LVWLCEVDGSGWEDLRCDGGQQRRVIPSSYNCSTHSGRVPWPFVQKMDRAVVRIEIFPDGRSSPRREQGRQFWLFRLSGFSFDDRVS